MHAAIRATVLGLSAVACVAATATAAGNRERPAVVELFTSQGCSSCPAADALVTELAASRRDLLPLTFHVTYWNGLGWRDPYSLADATARQQRYAAARGSSTVYTPEMVIEGATDLVGSDRAAADRALGDLHPGAAAGLKLVRTGQTVAIALDAGKGRGTIWLIGFDAQHRTPVGRGENGGRTLLESNIVRSVRNVGEWTGAPLRLETAPPEGEQLAAIVQSSDGPILDAARLESPS